MRFAPLLFTAAGLCACDAGDPADANDFRAAPALEVVAAFDAAAGETPESVAVLLDGSLAVSMALTGEIRRIATDGAQTTLAWVPLGQCAPNPFPPILGALAVSPAGDVFVGASTCDPAARGVYRVSPAGGATLVATLPPTALPNGIAVRLGQVYIADSASPTIWRAPIAGTGSPAEVWAVEPLLADPDPFDPFPGANGLQFYKGAIYVANASTGSIVAIPFTLDGWDLVAGVGYVAYGPGPDAESMTPPEFPGCDDFAFDLFGRIICTTDPFQTVVMIQKNGGIVGLWDAEDGLDGPTAAVFGRGADRKMLYISNASFPFFPSTGNGPSILATEWHVAGYPFR